MTLDANEIKRLFPQASFSTLKANATMVVGSVVFGPSDTAQPTPESKLHNEIIAACKARGWICWHGSMAHRSRRTLGESDFTIMADHGRVFFVECKTKTGKLSEGQAAMAAWARKLCHTIHVVRTIQEFNEITK